jgi:acetolactate synthase-1/2/3 large subunit
VVGNDAFQEADITGITLPVTKHNFLVKDANELAATIREAFHIASTGRPGPVLVDIPKDVQLQEIDWDWPEVVELPGYKPTTKGNLKQVRSAVKMIMEAKRPVLYVGGGVIKANSTKELYKLAVDGKLPVITTLMARGAFPDPHELALGMPGMHGCYTAVTAMQRSDLLVALGARFDDRVTGQLASFAPNAKVIHVDIDPAEIGKNRAVDVPIVGDAKDVITKLHAELKRRQEEAGGCLTAAWLAAARGRRVPVPLRRTTRAVEVAVRVDGCASRRRHRSGVGVGQHQMHLPVLEVQHPRKWTPGD